MPEVSSQPGSAERTTGPSQNTDRFATNFEPTQDEQTVVRDWLKRVSRAEDRNDTKKWRDSLKELRTYERGAQSVDQQKSRTNMVYATLAAQLPKLYAQNPTIAVTPTDAVADDEVGKVKRFCATAEKVVRKMLVEEGKLKKRAKANIRSTTVTSFGALKMLFQSEYRGDPIAVRRIEDAQDNLARVEALVQQLKKTDDPTELAKKRDELRSNLKALSANNEVSIFKGFTVDRIKSEDFLVLDDGVAEFDEYVDARALGHKIWMRVSQFETLFRMKPHGATRYGQPRTDADDKRPDDTPSEDQYVCVVEIWDKENGVVRTTAKGMNRWCREPYAPQNVPQRWYPFYLLGFNLTEGDWRPMSDVEMLMKLQDEYDRTRQNYADVREKAVPKRIVRKGGNLSEEDVKNVMNSGNQDWVAVEGNPQVPIAQDVMQLEGLKIDPQAYDVSAIRNDMDIVSGSTDAGRANLIQPKTATEAEIMAEAMSSRLGERRDVHEDLLSEMGEASLEISLRTLSKHEVQQIAGANAEWPDTPQGVEQVFRMVSVKVRAGSSGKPNMQREREQWGQLMPVIKDTMQQVAELRAQGNFDMAEATLELMRETLRRYDEHLDLDAIIPPTERDDEGKPLAHQQAAAQLVQAQQMIAQLQEQMGELQKQLEQAKSGEAAKVREAELRADEEARQASRKAEEQALETERERARQAADEQRQHEMKVAEQARIAEEARIADERAKRELAAKQTTDERVALIKVAGEIVKAEISAAAAARVKDSEAQQAAETRDLSESRFTEIAGRIDQTVAALTKTMQAMEQGAAERTALVRQHLTAEVQ